MTTEEWRNPWADAPPVTSTWTRAPWDPQPADERSAEREYRQLWEQERMWAEVEEMRRLNHELRHGLRTAVKQRELAAAIKEWRRLKPLSQNGLARKARVGVRLVHELEHGRTNVHLDKLLAVLDVLGLELHLVPAEKQARDQGPFRSDH